mmetsp:Transcript_5054/g.13475  ORF Transcript_5054/g.13475 Transcript_5054/m.13475 type:complete len:85 (+) Transcript_5054:1534-1788(+)
MRKHGSKWNCTRVESAHRHTSSEDAIARMKVVVCELSNIEFFLCSRNVVCILSRWRLVARANETWCIQGSVILVLLVVSPHKLL